MRVAGELRHQPTLTAASRQRADVIVAPAQAVSVLLTAGGLGAWAVVNPIGMLRSLFLALTVLYVIALTARVWLSLRGARASYPAAPALAAADLPGYTVLVPLFGEASVLPSLIEAMARLDYPADRLEILLLLEADDLPMWTALAATTLPPTIRPLAVPDAGPRGKPRACNAGLTVATGDLLVIYDAEDVPAPDQLRLAAAQFAIAPPQLGCVQARLDFYNPGENLLTSWFTAEYASWFGMYLRGLQAAGLPIPLGGTSNHFRTTVLRQLGGWDDYNVTEDADLGLCLARAGYQTALIDSVTWEEANRQPGNWVRQRSRWVKGYLVTWLVHMRHPLTLLRELGLPGFLSVQLTLAFTTFSSLLNPLFWALALIWLVLQPPVLQTLFDGPGFYLGSISMYAGNWLMIALAIIACYLGNHPRLARHAFLLPAYWALISFAAWKGVLQLIHKPYYWEKTVHGLTNSAASRPVDLAAAAPLPLPVSAVLTDASGVPGPGHPALIATATPAVTGTATTAGTPAPGRGLTWRDALAGVMLSAGFSALALWGSLHQHLFHPDALTSTYAAVQALIGQEPKLATVGMVWPVLPTALQLPLVALAPGLAAQGAIAPLMSSLAAAFGVVALNRLLIAAGLPAAVRWPAIALCFLNPLVLSLAINGSGEMVFIAGVLLAWWGCDDAARHPADALPGILAVTIGACVMLLSETTGLLTSVTLIAALLILLARRSGPLPGGNTLEAVGAIGFGTLGYAVALLLFFGQTITGNLLQFVLGTGSRLPWPGLPQTLAGSMTLPLVAPGPASAEASRAVLTGTTQAASAFGLAAAGALLAVLIAAGLLLTRRVSGEPARRLAVLAGLTVLVPAPQLITGTSEGNPGQGLAIAVIFGLVLAAALAETLRAAAGSLARPSRPAWSAAGLALLVLGLVSASTLVAWQAGRAPGPSPLSASVSYLHGVLIPTADAARNRGDNDGQRLGQLLAATVLTTDPDARILVDDQQATAMLLFSGHPANFVVPSLSTFNASLAAPELAVDYLLVPEATPATNRILAHYPELLTYGAPNLTLVATYQEQSGAYEQWFLFAIDPDPAASHDRAN